MAEAQEKPQLINTVRGNLMIAKALAYAIAAIDALPDNMKEASDRDDMVHILTTNFPQWMPLVAASVQCHTSRCPDLKDYKTDTPAPDLGEIFERITQTHKPS